MDNHWGIPPIVVYLTNAKETKKIIKNNKNKNLELFFQILANHFLADGEYKAKHQF